MAALALLAQPGMFAGANWVNMAGAGAAVAALAWEIMRGRVAGGEPRLTSPSQRPS
jgi:hypothetical protein